MHKTSVIANKCLHSVIHLVDSDGAEKRERESERTTPPRQFCRLATIALFKPHVPADTLV